MSEKKESQFRVICPNCGPVELTNAQYLAQLVKASRPWHCPLCGDDAVWDDDWYEAHMEV